MVTKAREELRSPDASVFVNEGMIKLKRLDGRAHPMLRAIAPEGAPHVDVVLDATIGLASDAVHLAFVLGVKIDGIEGAEVLCCLLEEGLLRLGCTNDAWADVTRRISVTPGRALDVLRDRAEGSVPVVYFDPMFGTPLKAAPGFTLLRRIALPDPLDEATLSEAIRVARDRVVLKVPHGDRPTAEVQPGFNRRVCGRAVDYLVVEKALPNPSWEHRNLPAGAY